MLCDEAPASWVCAIAGPGPGHPDTGVRLRQGPGDNQDYAGTAQMAVDMGELAIPAQRPGHKL